MHASFDPSLPPPTIREEDCPFCAIAAAHPPWDPIDPPHPFRSPPSAPTSYVVLSTPALIAFLDILPLSHGHLLLCTRAHRPKLTDVTAPEARDLGECIRLLSAALVRATGIADWNVVQNNGAAAAQVVPHMHYHLIPRPEIRASGRYRESFTMFGRGQREELDEDEAEQLAEELRQQIADILREEQEDREDAYHNKPPKHKL
ncbi:HIT-like protein [Trichoderma citrinoviride]|uniref:HIT-like protein n=1 Tax=Trichoderma citrinoviride TaxID=58853 RepID=A0A2T4BEE9_9HYPO|nr:HIT-like protein [Trichoderma citrinoviride]PTB67713.1 HIT-like protein [Trichoderma citrinoviride]